MFTVIVSVLLRFHAGVQLFMGVFTLVVFAIVACFFDRGGKIYRKEQACRVKSIIHSRISMSKESVIQCRISTNYEQPRQSVVQSRHIKSY